MRCAKKDWLHFWKMAHAVQGAEISMKLSVRQQLPRVNVPHISIAMELNGGA